MWEIDLILNQLTLKEKAALCAGDGFWHTAAVQRLGIPSILMTDGPHWLRKEIGPPGAGLAHWAPATCFPTASCLASSWDRNLLWEVGQAIARSTMAHDFFLVSPPFFCTHLYISYAYVNHVE